MGISSPRVLHENVRLANGNESVPLGRTELLQFVNCTTRALPCRALAMQGKCSRPAGGCPRNRHLGRRSGRSAGWSMPSLVGTSEMAKGLIRSEEHTSELQSLMRISYAVFCLKKKKKIHT